MFIFEDHKICLSNISCCGVINFEFVEVSPNFVAFKKFLLTKRKTEYCIAYKKGKLSNHFKKWAFDI